MYLQGDALDKIDLTRLNLSLTTKTPLTLHKPKVEKDKAKEVEKVDQGPKLSVNAGEVEKFAHYLISRCIGIKDLFGTDLGKGEIVTVSQF